MFASRPEEVYWIAVKAGKQLKKHYDDLEEWKHKYVTMVFTALNK